MRDSRESHQWDDNLGRNFTDTGELHKELMHNKNMQTQGQYQADVSGMSGEFTIAVVFKALPDEYHILNNILVQTGIQFRKYTYADLMKYGQTPWQLAIRNGKKYKPVNKEQALIKMQQNPKIVLYEVVKKSTQLDHVIVSPYGIFVIETKNHKGMIFGDMNGQVWTQVLGGGKMHCTFYNPVRQNQEHLIHLSQKANIPMNTMKGLIVFTSPDVVLRNVDCTCCCTTDSLIRTLDLYKQKMFDPKQVENIIHLLEKVNSSNYTLDKEHITYVNDIKHRYEINKLCKAQGIR